MSDFLEPFTAANERGRRDLSVLAGVVDGLCPPLPLMSPCNGLSVLRGSLEHLMPDLWLPNGRKPAISLRSRGAEQKPAAIKFWMNKPEGWPGLLDVTLPLANSVFVNNRESTLLAMQWSAARDQKLAMDRMIEMQTQSVNLWTESEDPRSEVEIPLIPITRPRLVVAGLTNMVRQIEVDGKVVPASYELEDIVVNIINRRHSVSTSEHKERIDVWALVIPPGASSRKIADLASLQATPDPADTDGMARYLQGQYGTGVNLRWLEEGCRFHKICKIYHPPVRRKLLTWC